MDPYVGEIRLVGFNFAPQGWALCNGQTLPISQNTALFALLGTQYGGDGRSTFALPNLQGFIPIGMGSNALGQYYQGETGGASTVTLTTVQIPSHTHKQQGTTAAANTNLPSGAAFAQGGGRGHGLSYYQPVPGSGSQATMASLASSGGDQTHDNMMPYLTMYYIIALQGIFPPRQ